MSEKALHIRLEQLNPTIGDLIGNRSLILDSIKKAESDGIDLLILPELAVWLPTHGFD